MPIQPIHQRDKNSDGIEPSPVPGLAPTGLLPLTAAQEAVLARLDDRIKATPITAREPSVHMAAGSQVVASPAMSSVTPATGSTQEQSWYLPSIVGEPRYRVMATCETLESLASVQQVPDQNVLNWGMVDSIWGENGAVNTAGVLHPKNLYDLAASVRSVEQLGETARAFGSLFSFSDAVFPLPNEPTGPNPKTSGHSIDTSQLNKSLQQLLPGIGVTNTGFTPDRYFFVEAGIKLYDLNMALDQHGLALPTLGGSAGQSLAGAISTGTHGCDFDRPPIADAVVGLYLVGAGGTHHWIEGSLPVTDPEKLQAVFPCLQSENIHYDSDMLHAVQVSFGSMGVIYAALLRVVPQYTLVQLTRRGTWEGLIQSKSQGGAGTDLSDAMNGTWSGLNAYLDMIYPPASNQRNAEYFQSRALQVVLNPIKNDDGSHTCWVTNRAQVPAPFSGSYGSPPGNLVTMNLDDVLNTVQSDQRFNDWGVQCSFNGFRQAESGRPNTTAGMIQKMKDFVWFCEHNGYAWAARAVITFVCKTALPEAYQESDPASSTGYTFQGDVYTDIGHKVMTNGVIGGQLPFQSFASMEAFFDLAGGITYVNAILKEFDASVDAGAYPAGYISLRLCGRTAATLGQERTSPTACVEITLLATDNAAYFIKRANQIALINGGFLHWGQNNGSMFATNVALTFSASAVQAWRTVQQKLGGATFTNWFMKRLGLA